MEHHLALVAHAQRAGATMNLEAQDFQETLGEGVSATVQNHKVQVGSRRLALIMHWARQSIKTFVFV